jgi:hypothetical protein
MRVGRNVRLPACRFLSVFKGFCHLTDPHSTRSAPWFKQLLAASKILTGFWIEAKIVAD